MAVIVDREINAPEPGDTAIGSSGYTLTALAEYLEAGRSPRIAAIESDPECQAALDQLARARALGVRLLESDAGGEGADEQWMRGLIDAVAFEVRAGRDIPLAANDGLAISEGALREAMRQSVDAVDGVLVGRCRIEGRMRDAADEISVTVQVSVEPVRLLSQYAELIRAAVIDAVLRHTNLNLLVVDVEIVDVHLASGGVS